MDGYSKNNQIYSFNDTADYDHCVENRSLKINEVFIVLIYFVRTFYNVYINAYSTVFLKTFKTVTKWAFYF